MLARTRVLARQGLRFARPQASLRSFSTATADVKEDDAVEKKEGGGVLQFLQDMPATTAVPVGILALIAGISNDVVVIDAEMQIAALFVGFVGTVYTQAGDAVGQMLDETSDQILEEQNAAEEADIAGLRVLRDLHAKQTTVHEEMSTVFSATHSLMDELVVAKSNKLQHDVRNQVVRMLDGLVVQEGNTQREIQSALVEHAVAHVQSQATSKAMKASALDEALAVIADPSKGAPADAIGGLFQDYFNGFNSRLEAARQEDHPVDAAVAAEIEASAAALIARDGLDMKFTAPTSVKIGDF